MKQMCRFIIITVILSISIVYSTVHVIAADAIASGSCGDAGNNLSWMLDSEGALTISGTGSMANYSARTAPWYYNRGSIKDIIIDAGVTSIGNYAFYSCTQLTSVTIPNGVTSIGQSAFFGCSDLVSVTIDNNVTTIGKEAFAECDSLTTVTLPTSITAISNGMFTGCGNLSSIVIPDSVTSIEEYAFYSSGLSSVAIPDSVTFIGRSAFAWCKNLSSVTFGNNVATIGESAFSECSMLTSVTIPSSTAFIDKYAFAFCYNLTAAYFEGDAPNVNSCFGNDVTLYYIPGMRNWCDSDAYSTITGKWNGYQLEAWRPDGFVDVSPIAKIEVVENREILCSFIPEVSAFTKVLIGAYHPESNAFIGAASCAYDGNTNSISVLFNLSLPENCILRIFCLNDKFVPMYRVSEFFQNGYSF
ncbi:MAG: leucine-rich repeat domain-containing protein [Clostridia bacterium]|nr:leucine-rich repeat domain-containing protein [Clostridia bacterium]